MEEKSHCYGLMEVSFTVSFWVSFGPSFRASFTASFRVSFGFHVRVHSGVHWKLSLGFHTWVPFQDFFSRSLNIQVGFFRASLGFQ